jgi:hypothetical protein
VTYLFTSHGGLVVPDAAAFHLPEDLTGLSDDELAALHEQAVNAFDEIYAAENGPQAADVAAATELADGIERLTSEQTRRTTEAETAAQTLADLRNRVHGADDGDGEDGDGEDPEGGVADGSQPAAQDPALVADARPTGGARTGPRELGGLNPRRGNLNASLRAAQTAAPNPRVPRPVTDMVITAASATAGAPIGHTFTDLDAVSQFMHQHARSLSVTNGNPSYTPFVTVRDRHTRVIGENTDPSAAQAILDEITSPEVLVAAGGWCSPSVPRYDFFNIACQQRTGLVDVPTIGIDRGGMRWPVSPSLADVFTNPGALAPFGAAFSNASVPWLWTETDDVAAVTGTGTKPCIRVPCASFSEARLECYGFCVTAGNLADSAWPEATRNFLQLVMAAQIRVENLRYLTQMATLSTLSTAASGMGAAGAGVTAPVLGALELHAIDTRGKYGMCDDDVLEAVFPAWIKGAVRSDLAKRTGVSDLLNVTDQMIADWFDSRGVRAQFVGEYQQRTAGYPGYASSAITGWPTAVEFMLYPAGTFVRGDGMTLDLGVVRDSTLNAKNDHTAAWTEECHLIAMVGHQSRRVIVNICPDGTTGAADLTACGL